MQTTGMSTAAYVENLAINLFGEWVNDTIDGATCTWNKMNFLEKGRFRRQARFVMSLSAGYALRSAQDVLHQVNHSLDVLGIGVEFTDSGYEVTQTPAPGGFRPDTYITERALTSGVNITTLVSNLNFDFSIEEIRSYISRNGIYIRNKMIADPDYLVSMEDLSDYYGFTSLILYFENTLKIVCLHKGEPVAGVTDMALAATNPRRDAKGRFRKR